MATCMSRSGSSTGSSRRIPRVIEYIVVVEPIPRASASDASAAMPGERRIMRRPSRREDIWGPGTGNGAGNREPGKNLGMLLYARTASRGFPPLATRHPLPAPRLSDLPLLREVVQRQPAKAVVGRPVAAQRVDVAAQSSVALVLREVQVVDPDLADDVAVLRDLEALHGHRVGLGRESEVASGLGELLCGEVCL